METERARAWAYGQLSGDATLRGLVGARIYRAGEVPQGTPFPYLAYAIVTSTDRVVIGQSIIGAAVAIQVVAWGHLGETDERLLEQIMDRVQTLLHRQSGSVPGGAVYAATRTAIVPLPPELDGDQTYVPKCMEFSLETQAA